MMPLAWSCPLHGSFLQSGLLDLARIDTELQPRDRFACPVCVQNGQPGWVRPADESASVRLTANKGVN